MKRISLIIFKVFLLLFFALTVQAQNNSAENSDVIFMNQWYETTNVITCPETGPIDLTFNVHVVYKDLPTGILSDHFTAYGEGIDLNGDLWKAHEVFNCKWIPIPGVYDHLVHNFTLKGPKGAKLKMRFLCVRNGNGEIIHWKYDPLCD